MTITPGELLDTSISHLHTLAAFLGDQLGESTGGLAGPFASSEVSACREALISLSVLIPKLQAARNGTSGGVSHGRYTHQDEE